ncbi:DMT family transporter [Pikeienuella sp. HZG-20]|uniref:DMT family transporter n=1 Tax=Paludibacillus litoralis TaxID=3133267 RepID=UPI0030EB9565
MIRAREERPGYAIGLMLAVYICFTGIDTSAKWLVEAGIPVGQVVFVRYFGHLMMVLALFGPSQGASLWRMRSPRLTLVRGLMLLCATFANFTALQYLPMTITISIFFISPLLITASAALFLSEKVGRRRWTAIGIGLAGVLIITRPWGAAFQWAMLISLIPPIANAVYTLITRRLAGVEAPDTMQFWAALIPLIALTPFALTDWVWPVDGWSWLAFVMIGVSGWSGHQLFTLAHRYAEASSLAPLNYSHIVWISISSWLIFHQPPDRATLIGATVIILSGLYVWLRERRVRAR